MMKKYTTTKENKNYRDVRLSVSNDRVRYGCDICGKDHATEAFIGFRGNVLWIGEKCLKNLLNKPQKYLIKNEDYV